MMVKTAVSRICDYHQWKDITRIIGIVKNEKHSYKNHKLVETVSLPGSVVKTATGM